MTPVAIVAGQPITELPTDLFIPPDALEVSLELFTGPLDLLLYLIRSQNLDILDIPVFHITKQYMQYIESMKAQRVSLAADYLVMAALLAEIKSRLLLPKVVVANEEGEVDPRMELVRRLQTYEQFKEAAVNLEVLPREERDVFVVAIHNATVPITTREPEVHISQLMTVMLQILRRQSHLQHHVIQRELLPLSERMQFILQQLQCSEQSIELVSCWDKQEGHLGLLVTVLAVLELAKQAKIIVMQAGIFMPIYMRISV